MQDFKSGDYALKPIRDYFLLAKRDFFTSYLLGFTFFPFFLALVVFGIVLYFFGADWYNALFGLLHYDFGFEQIWLTWIQTLFDYTLKASVFVFFALALFGLSLLVSLAISAFVAPYVVRFIRDSHYPQCSLDGKAKLVTSLLGLFGIYVLYFLALILLLPVYFIPFVGGFVMLLPTYWLFFKTTLGDVGEEIFTKETLKLVKKTQKGRIQSVMLPLFGINLIPVIGFFSPVFALSVLAHLFFDIKCKDSYGNANTD
ncbi:hypothetical protein LS70_008010 [Helicobacter sp. MIT 11-5569]|uniref:EI24 domain-containing protein n=1 Tax=Helicobacter sp. MIT 11-5569 TaxID=1548151 RepID=UPI00068E2950|nr:EI24 domain-containing protein [Helicobacter sp. MIT 11-5569]TLD81226.1 hypothetical protein LS70_008010 [Helicobacter sp. MIT 11-5569]